MIGLVGLLCSALVNDIRLVVRMSQKRDPHRRNLYGIR
jgi:hypothetical protein